MSFRCILLCSNTKITFPKHMIFTCASERIKKVPKPSISPYISIINQAPRWRTISKAINAIKANASCDHERALHSQIRPSPPDTKMETINSTVFQKYLFSWSCTRSAAYERSIKASNNILIIPHFLQLMPSTLRSICIVI